MPDRDAPPPPPPASPDARGCASARPPPALLVADDNQGDALLLELACADAGLAVRIIHVGDGERAWALLQEAARAPTFPYALAVLDLNLRLLDGLELLARMRGEAALAQLPTILFTSSTSPDDQARALRLRPSAYLVKPADYRGLSTVVATVRALLAG
jgi:CheY-like chemotaxis protein